MVCERKEAKKKAGWWLVLPLIPIVVATSVRLDNVAASNNLEEGIHSSEVAGLTNTRLDKPGQRMFRYLGHRLRYSAKASLCCRARVCCSKAS